MGLASKIAKFLRDPVRVIAARAGWLRARMRYELPEGYRAEEYWRDRHGRYGFDLRGVGDLTKTESENKKILDEGRRLFLRLCSEARVSLGTVSLLDIGCGTGYFAGVFRDGGGTDYTGVDIVDTLFGGLRERFPRFTFEVLDVSARPITGSYGLIIMMDVLQHITDEKRFTFALENARSHLAEGGTIIISTNIGEAKRHSFYYVTRPMAAFQRLFEGWRFSEALEFSGNRMFSVRRP